MAFKICSLCVVATFRPFVAAKQQNIRIVDVRDEATAVFAADAVARLTGIPGVAAVTAGPGLTNTITAVKNAQMAQSPLSLSAVRLQPCSKGRGALQDIDQIALMTPHVKQTFAVQRARHCADFAGCVSIEPGRNTRAGFCRIAGRFALSGAGCARMDGRCCRKIKSLTGRATNWYIGRHIKRRSTVPGKRNTRWRNCRAAAAE